MGEKIKNIHLRKAGANGRDDRTLAGHCQQESQGLGAGIKATFVSSPCSR